MKKIVTLVITVLCAINLFAQAPEKFTYQALVRNVSNALVTNAPVGVRVGILQGGVSGTLVYMETQSAVTNANGLIALQIGGGTVQQGVFADIDWANGPCFLKTETDPNGGSDYSITSVQQLLSVPYALYAKDAGNILTVPANHHLSDHGDVPYSSCKRYPHLHGQTSPLVQQRFGHVCPDELRPALQLECGGGYV